MTETTEMLESLLQGLCKEMVKSTSNEQQTVYLLADAKDAKLAYDLLIACGLDVKLFAQDAGAKLYVQNLSVAPASEKLAAAMNSAVLFRQIKNLLDSDTKLADYTLSFTNTQAGRQLTLVLPADKQLSRAATKTLETAPAATSTAPQRARMAAKKEQDTLLAGPTVARTAIPGESAKEAPVKHAMLFLSTQAFTSGAWLAFIALILGVIFSILVTVKGFLCPDLAVNQDTIPSYCPQKAKPQQ